jgi:hypothetical protein
MHEQGLRHKNNVQQRIKQSYTNLKNDEIEKVNLQKELARIESVCLLSPIIPINVLMISRPPKLRLHDKR